MNKLLYLVLILANCMGIFAQNSNSITVTNRSVSVLNLAKIFKAGMEGVAVVDDSQWLNYSIKSNPEDPLESIAVSISSGTVPPGIEVFVEADHDNGNGWGKVGNPTGKVKLSQIPSVLINNIGTGGTGNGKYKGHKLTMSIEVVDFAQLQPGDFTLFLLYTLQ